MPVTIAQFILSLELLLLAAYIAAMNWACVILSRRNRRRGIDRHHSTVPLVSLLISVVALIFYPRPDKAAWMLAVPLLDIGNWALLLGALWLPVMTIRESSTKKSAEHNAGNDHR